MYCAKRGNPSGWQWRVDGDWRTAAHICRSARREMQRLEEAQVVQHIVTSLLFRLGCFKFSGGNILFYITLVFGSPESFYAKFLVQTTAFIHKKKKNP